LVVLVGNSGRDSEQSTVVMDTGDTRLHAVIEVNLDGSVVICNNHSVNDTFKNYRSAIFMRK
jgi:hypothetical protein